MAYRWAFPWAPRCVAAGDPARRCRARFPPRRFPGARDAPRGCRDRRHRGNRRAGRGLADRQGRIPHCVHPSSRDRRSRTGAGCGHRDCIRARDDGRCRRQTGACRWPAACPETAVDELPPAVMPEWPIRTRAGRARRLHRAIARFAHQDPGAGLRRAGRRQAGLRHRSAPRLARRRSRSVARVPCRHRWPPDAGYPND